MSVKQFYEQLPNIAFFAPMRSGKDKVFEILEGMGFNVERVAFGDVMKERFFETFPWIPKEPKPTAELIQYGQAMRAIDPDVWVRPTMARMKVRTDLLAQAGLNVPTFMCTDVRQPNEYTALKRAGFVMVHIHAPETVRVKRMLDLGEKPTAELLRAPTEVAMEQFEYDYVIDNSGTLAELETNVTEFVYSLQIKRLSDNFKNQQKRGTYK